MSLSTDDAASVLSICERVCVRVCVCVCVRQRVKLARYGEPRTKRMDGAGLDGRCGFTNYEARLGWVQGTGHSHV